MAEKNSKASCAGCGVEIEKRKGRGRPRKWCPTCSPTTRVGSRVIRTPKAPDSPRHCLKCFVVMEAKIGRPLRLCGVCQEEKRKSRKYVKGRRVEKSCGWCAKPMLLKPGVARVQNFCSRPCAMRARLVAEGKTGRRQMVRCRGCGDCSERKVRKHNDSGEYCSRECYTAWKIRLSGEKQALKRIAANWYVKPGKEPLSKVEEEIAALRRIARWAPGRSATVRPCVKCGRKAKGSGNRRRMCIGCALVAKASAARRAKKSESGKARKRIYKARRRALERGVTADKIDPIKVFERDGWKCHICHRRTPKALRGTYDDRAPEMDHVVPLAAGGTHTWGNVKCSCRQCNGAKSDRPLGQVGMDWAA